MSPTTPMRILIVEDDPRAIYLLNVQFPMMGFHAVDVRECHALNDALTELGMHKFDVILLDLSLTNGTDPIEAVRKVHEASDGAAIIVITGTVDEAMGVKAIQAGAQDFLIKASYTNKDLEKAIRYGMERKRAAQRFDEAKKAVGHAIQIVEKIKDNKDDPLAIHR